MNSVHIIGRLVQDPEVSSNERAPVRFAVAVDRVGSEEADFFDVAAWGKLGQAVAQHMEKGRLVGVQGRLRQERWENADGERRSRIQIVAGGVDFLDTKRPGALGAEEEAEEEPAF